MVRVLYTITVLSLLGASAVIASGIDNRQFHLKGGAGVALMINLQR